MWPPGTRNTGLNYRATGIRRSWTKARAPCDSPLTSLQWSPKRCATSLAPVIDQISVGSSVSDLARCKPRVENRGQIVRGAKHVRVHHARSDLYYWLHLLLQPGRRGNAAGSCRHFWNYRPWYAWLDVDGLPCANATRPFAIRKNTSAQSSDVNFAERAPRAIGIARRSLTP
jgi:hypothetical protein